MSITTTAPSSPTSYATARLMVSSAAKNHSQAFERTLDSVPVLDALNCVTACAITSPITSPARPSSAMDGYCLSASTTLPASSAFPLIYRVVATCAAGDPPLTIPPPVDEDPYEPPAVEITTGACIPYPHTYFDAVVKHEDVVTGLTPGSIIVTSPVARGSNIRLAGTDFLPTVPVLLQRTRISHNHLLALSSLGIPSITVLRKPRVAILSTGAELIPHTTPPDRVLPHQTRDANRPYIAAYLAHPRVSAEVVDHGIVADSVSSMAHGIQEAVARRPDVLLSTGGVSKGRYDLVRDVVSEKVGGRVMFHGVRIRPGGPVLFALLPEQQLSSRVEGTSSNSDDDPPTPPDVSIPFFGLPGNPIAAAACLRFLVVPYLRALHGLPDEEPFFACIRRQPISKLDGHPFINPTAVELKPLRKPPSTVAFWHGRVSVTSAGGLVVQVHPEQSSGICRPFGEANCWVEVPEGVEEVAEGEVVRVWGLVPGQLDFS